MRTKFSVFIMILCLIMAGVVPTTIALTAPSEGDNNVTINPKNETYAVAGNCCCQAADNLEDPAGSTQAHFKITYKSSASATSVEVEEEEPEEQELQSGDPAPDGKKKYKGTAKVTSVNVIVDITVRMPKATNASNFPESCQAAWTNFVNALQAHEDAHVKDIKKIANGSLKAEADGMVGFSVTTPGLYDTAAEAIQAALDRLDEKMQTKIQTAVNNADAAWEKSAEELHKEIGETVDFNICDYCLGGHQ